MIIPGLVSATFKNLGAQEVIALAGKNGLEALEWSEKWHLAPGDVARAALIGDLTRRAGLRVAALGSYFRLGTGGDIGPSLDNARAMGAPVVRIWGGDRPSRELSEGDRARLAEEARDAAGRAAALGLTLALEWHRNTVTDRNESGAEFLARVGHPHLRTLWQPTPDLTYEERLEGLGMIAGDLVNFHVYYWDESGRRPLGEGAGHWASYFRAAGGGRDYYALLEFVREDNPEQLAEDAAALRTWLSGSWHRAEK